MQLRERSNTTQNSAPALLLLAASVAAFSILLLTTSSIPKIIAVLLLSLAVVWFIRDRLIPDFGVLRPVGSPFRTGFLVGGLFFSGALLASLVIWVTRPDSYIRPISFQISLMVCLFGLFLQIAFSSSGRTAHRLLVLEVAAFSLLVVLSLPAMYPGVVGIDPWYHRAFTMRIMQDGNVVPGAGYSGIPSTHIDLAVVGLVTSQEHSYRLAYMSAMVTLVLVTMLGIYCLARRLFGAQVAIAAIAVLATAEFVVEMETLVLPTAFSFAVVPLCLWAVLPACLERQRTSTVLVFIIFAFLVASSHPLTSLVLLIMLISMWLSSFLSTSVIGRARTGLPLGYPLVFAVIIITWWSLATVPIESLKELLGLGLNFDFESRGPLRPSLEYIAKLPAAEILASQLGFLTYLGLGGGGFLLTLRLSRRESIHRPWLYCQFAVFIGVAIGSLLELGGLLPARWFFYTQSILAVSIGLSIALTVASMSSRARITIVALALAIVMVVPVLASPRVNSDNPILSADITVRNALTVDEEASMSFMRLHYDGTMRSDQFCLYFLAFGIQPCQSNLVSLSASNAVPYDESFLSGDLTGFTGITIIRNEVIENPLFSNGPYVLPFDPIIEAQNMTTIDKVFSSGAVQCYYQIG